MTILEAAKTAFLKRAPRHSVNTNAWIRQKGSFGLQPCRVIDVSRSGAKLEVENPQNIPDKIFLLFSKSDFGNDATVVRRHGTEIGVEFSSADPRQLRA